MEATISDKAKRQVIFILLLARKLDLVDQQNMVAALEEYLRNR